MSRMRKSDDTLGRKIVYVLGAGASRGAGAVAAVQAGGTVPIPLQSDFWDVFLTFSRSIQNRHLIEAFLFRYFYGYSRVPSRASSSTRRSMVSGIDVEEVFTFRSERSRAPSTTPQLRKYVHNVWDALVDEIGNVFGRFEANSETRRTYRALHRNQLRTRDAVVSFNYDCVFELSLPYKVRWAYEGLEDVTGALRVLKPHGSVGWRQTATNVTRSDSLRDALVVAPTHLKFVATAHGNQPNLRGYLDQAPVLANIWSAMERHMRSAKALVFIGYSFPVADLYFSSLLRSVLADRGRSPTVVVVNPDAVAIGARLQTRFSLSGVTRLFDLKQLVGMSRSEVLKLGVG